MPTATALQPEHGRTSHVEVLQQEIFNTCGNFRIVPRGPDPQMLGGVEVSERGVLEFAKIDIGHSSVRRGNREIRQATSDPYFLILQAHGRAEMFHAGSVTCLDRGGIFVVDSEKSSEFNFHEDRNQQVSFRLSRNEVHHRFGEMVRRGLFIFHKPDQQEQRVA